MKRANGTGTISDKGKKYRNRYVPRLTIGYDENGKAKYKYLKPCRTKKEAYKALDEFVKNEVL